MRHFHAGIGIVASQAAGGGGGGGGAVFSLTEADAYSFGTATIAFASDGTYTATQPITDNTGDWVDPGATGIGADYEIMATVVGGTAPAGSMLATWLSLSTARSWYLSGAGSSTLDIKIREASSGTVMVQRADCTIVRYEAGPL